MQIRKSRLIFFTSFLLCFSCGVVKQLPVEWHLKDYAKDGFQGISLDLAYEAVKEKTSRTIIVAVIDSGIDTTHEDLRGVLWQNAKEIPNNKIDDDQNGYIDDIYGWNFLGGSDGTNLTDDSYEAARIYHRFKSKYEGMTDKTMDFNEERNFLLWKQARVEVHALKKSFNGLQMFIVKGLYKRLANNDKILREALGKEVYSGRELIKYQPKNPSEKSAKSYLLMFFESENSIRSNNLNIKTDLLSSINQELKKRSIIKNAPFNYRENIIKDDESDINDKYYGNNDVMTSTSSHGTHVAGIIGAIRNNILGVNGIANNVRIMAIRAVPDGDEYDKDIALAIRYAVDNGARIINLSFGKGLSPDKAWADEAVKYAELHNVLIVHAAGNEGSDNDRKSMFPTPVYNAKNEHSSTWITVGASGSSNFGGVVASFSNYGKRSVDVFAPGTQIYSTLPVNNSYGSSDGTSMAAPVVTGTAAFILSYFPKLTAQQIKYIIEESVVKDTIDHRYPFIKLCTSGGVINAFYAIKLAEKIVSQ
jgi:subtilisin family serine protease